MIHTVDELTQAAVRACQDIQKYTCRILVCSGTGCIATGSKNIHKLFETLVQDTPGVSLVFSPCGGHHEETVVGVKNTGCQGFCELGPLVRIQKGDRVIQYVQVQPEDCPEIFHHEETVVGVKNTGCQGFCELGPLVRIQKGDRVIQYVQVQPEDCPEIFHQSVLGDQVIERLLYKKGDRKYVQPEEIPFIAKQYVQVQPEDCPEIFHQSVLGDQVIERLLYKKGDRKYVQPEEIPFIAKQTRIVLENCGKFDAESLDEYLAAGGFQALKKAMFQMDRDQVIDEVDKSGLRGRGGGGFPTGRKWKQVARQKETVRYVVCNGDEGDPGAFMDGDKSGLRGRGGGGFPTGRKWKQVARQKETVRYVVCNGDEGDPGAFMDGSVMEGDPFKLIEGMMIAAYAVRAENGYIYVRAEYPNSVERLKNAIAQLEERGLLGEHILGTDFTFHMIPQLRGAAEKRHCPAGGAGASGRAHSGH